MSGHTPGPWKARSSPSSSAEIYIEAPSFSGTHLVAGVAGRRRDENEANARLIAAAPELLEACEGYIAEIENPSPDTVMRRHWRNKMRHAITKAKGE